MKSEVNRWDSASPLVNRRVSASTAHDYYRALHSFFDWLKREELIHDNPFTYLKSPRTENKVIQAPTPNEIERLLSVCAANTTLDIRNKAMISILLDCGLHASELASLTMNDVDLNSGSILIRHSNGKKQRVVRIGSKARKALWKYVTIYRKSESDRLFINRIGQPLDVIGIKILIKQLGEKTNLKVHPHKLRHTFAISYLRAGGEVFSLQYLLGHSTFWMTQRYLQLLNADDAVNAHNKFSPLDNMGIKKG